MGVRTGRTGRRGWLRHGRVLLCKCSARFFFNRSYAGESVIMAKKPNRDPDVYAETTIAATLTVASLHGTHQPRQSLNATKRFYRNCELPTAVPFIRVVMALSLTIVSLICLVALFTELPDRPY